MTEEVKLMRKLIGHICNASSVKHSTQLHLMPERSIPDIINHVSGC